MFILSIVGEPLQICSHNSKCKNTTLPWPLLPPESTAILYFSLIFFNLMVIMFFVSLSLLWENTFSIFQLLPVLEIAFERHQKYPKTLTDSQSTFLISLETLYSFVTCQSSSTSSSNGERASLAVEPVSCLGQAFLAFASAFRSSLRTRRTALSSQADEYPLQNHSHVLNSVPQYGESTYFANRDTRAVESIVQSMQLFFSPVNKSS